MGKSSTRYEVSSAMPTPSDAVRRLRQLALDAGDDVHKGIGSGSWLIERSHDQRVFNLAALQFDHVERLLSNQPGYPDPHCAQCDGTGRVEVDNGGAKSRVWQVCECARLGCRLTPPPPLRSFTTSSLDEVEGTMRVLDHLGFPYRLTSGIDLSNEFVGDLTGWLVEVLDTGGAP